METRPLAHLKGLKIPTTLANTPSSAPRRAVKVKNSQGEEVLLGDPTYTRGLVLLMNQHAVIGGAAAHWGGPSAFAEIMSSLHGLMFNRDSQWYEDFNFVNDAGHAENGIYALRANYGFDNLEISDLKGFRSIDSKLTGHGEAHLNPEGVYISNGPLGSGLPQAQGLALADKILGNDRVTVCAISDGGSMEGEAKEAFSAIAGLAGKGKLNPFLMVISDNDTKLSGRITSDSYSMTPSFNSLEALGWDLVRLEDGHDIQKVFTTLEQALDKAKSNPKKPVAVVCKTIKGYGIKETEESSSGGHGYPLKPFDERLVPFLEELYKGEVPEELETWAKEILSNKPESSQKPAGPVKKEKVQVGSAKAVIKAASEGLPVFSVSADLQGSTGMKAFQSEFPDRWIDVGVAEANMISTAVGLSKQGLIPIVDTFSQFGITKGNLPLIMAGLSQAPVVGIFSHIGFQDAADGASHQATTYFAATSAIPHLEVISLSCSHEAESLVHQGLKRFAQQREAGEIPSSLLFFMGRENHPQYYKEGLQYEWGKAQVYTEGEDITIVTTGPLVGKALEASEKLLSKGLKATVIGNPFINRPDTKTIGEAINKTGGRLITLEDHQAVGGMGAQLIHALNLAGVKLSAVRTLATAGKFGQSAYKADHLYKLHGLDADSVVRHSLEMSK